MRDESRATMRERGFSMIEMIIAMLVTMIIMGAVYGLIAGGQNAFRREPEMAERQQNIRMAMDLIMKDIANTGSGLPTFVQTFTPGLNDLGPMGPDGLATDEIEMLTNSESRDTEPVCRTIGTANGANVNLIRDVTVGTNPIPPNTVVVPFTANGQWTLRTLVSTAQNGAVVAGTDCTAGAHTLANIGVADPPIGLNTPGSACLPNGWGDTVSPCELVGLSFANLVRYRIRLDPAGVPMLERWSSDSPGAIAGGARAEAAFQTIARGIENLQVQYLRADSDAEVPGDWTNDVPAVVPGTYGSLTTQVRVLLAARSEAQNIAGATTSASGGNAIRGTLVSSGSPRATLMNISLMPQPVPPASPVPYLWR